MTSFLIRIFIGKNYDSEDPKIRSALGKLGGILGMACNFLLFAGKLLAGILSGSIAILSDAMNNLTDASGSVVTLIGFRMGELPPDKKHPFGHARFEYLSGLAVAAGVVIIGFELAENSVRQIIHPEAVHFSLLSVGILLASIAVKLWLSEFQRRVGKEISSAALIAAADDSRNDCISTGAVLLAAGIQLIFKINVDAWLGLGVALFILWNGAMLAKDTISPLLGEAASPELVKKITDYIAADDRILGFHDLMVHDYGPGQQFASVHVEMDQKLEPLYCHEIIDDMERECYESHRVHLVIHYDPVVTDDPEQNRLKKYARRCLEHMDPELSLHDFRMVDGEGHINLIFDVVLPAHMQGREEEIRENLEQVLSRQEGKQVFAVLTFDRPAVRADNSHEVRK